MTSKGRGGTLAALEETKKLLKCWHRLETILISTALENWKSHACVKCLEKPHLLHNICKIPFTRKMILLIWINSTVLPLKYLYANLEETVCVHSWDTSFSTFETADYTAVTKWAYNNRGYYLLDAKRFKASSEHVERRILREVISEQPHRVLI